LARVSRHEQNPPSRADTSEADGYAFERCPASHEGARRRAKETQAMLILTRKVDQGIVISGNILVRVLGVERDRVKIGISAPGEITVLRQELWHEGQDDQPFERPEHGKSTGATNGA
jgi:carbon storage regulator